MSTLSTMIGMKTMKLWTRVLCALVMAMSLAAPAAETVIYYHNDLAGSPVVATDATGNVIWRESYRPYGERLTNAPASADNKIWFTSRRQDVETGLVYMGARYYDPVIGRFISKDPKGFDEANIHSHNRYAYANNNPYGYIDPDGRTAAAVVLAGAGALVIGGGFHSPPHEQQAIVLKGLGQLAQYTAIGQLGSLLSGVIKSEGSVPGDKDPATPTGRRGSPMDVPKGTNEDSQIGGRDYGGHALDQMQGRGVPPSAVEGAIRDGKATPGNKPGRTVHTGADGLTVVTEGDRVITVINK